jgi:hypothetical protein
MAGDSWNVWWIALIGAHGEALTAPELAVFRRVTGRDPPTDAFQLKLIAAFIGRRGGKDTAAAVVVIFNALCRPWTLAPGEIGSVLLIAVDRVTSQIAFKRILGIVRAVPALKHEIASVTRETIVLKNGIEITVATSDFAAVRGRTVLCAVLDEFAFMPHEAALELVRSLRPGMAGQPGALIFIITTVYAAYGPAHELNRQYGLESPDQLIIRGTTRDFNPTISEAFIARELERDYPSASAEYLSIERTELQALIDAQLADRATRSGPRELPFRLATTEGTPIHYYGAVDVSGGRNDAAAAAVAHCEGDRVIIDAARHWPSPHDPTAVAVEVAAFLKIYGVCGPYADQYGAELARSIYAEVGVALLPAEITRSEAYLHMLPLFTSDRIEIPDDPTLRTELLGLERRTGRSGKDAVDHRPGQHDDVANACGLASWCASRNARSGDSTCIVLRTDVNSGLEDFEQQRSVPLSEGLAQILGGSRW